MESQYQKFKDKGVKVDVAEPKVTVERFVTKYKLSFPIPMATNEGIMNAYGVGPIPVTFLINENGVYVLNGHGNNTLGSGLHKSLNNGGSFEKVEGSGIQGEVMGLAVHPTNEDTLAVATKEGIFLSRDGLKACQNKQTERPFISQKTR